MYVCVHLNTSDKDGDFETKDRPELSSEGQFEQTALFSTTTGLDTKTD